MTCCHSSTHVPRPLPAPALQVRAWSQPRAGQSGGENSGRSGLGVNSWRPESGSEKTTAAGPSPMPSRQLSVWESLSLLYCLRLCASVPGSMLLETARQAASWGCCSPAVPLSIVPRAGRPPRSLPGS